ncbi:MAG: NAD(P)H-dependent oxidoreductase subunit E [Elusimicrobiota bacterium]|jgi:NADH-quinone oxidoreductase subunit E|nr:NAD(P)H-dependent oxidoreductase subunit E [Elusimicrobiota bacterium]
MSLGKLNEVIGILNKYDNNPNKLIPILQEVQREYNYLPQEAMTFVANSLGIAPSKVFGVATFFSHFSVVPKGKHIIKICDGTACHVKKSEGIINAVENRLALSPAKHTSSDLMFTLECVSCLGACGIAPVVVIDEEVFPQMTPEKTVALIEEIAAKETENAKS